MHRVRILDLLSFTEMLQYLKVLHYRLETHLPFPLAFTTLAQPLERERVNYTRTAVERLKLLHHLDRNINVARTVLFVRIDGYQKISHTLTRSRNLLRLSL